MFNYLQKALSGADNTASSRRLITFISVLVMVIIDLSIVALCYKVAVAPAANDHSIAAIEKLIQLSLIIKVFIMLLIGIITWQNINDSAKIIKGLPTTETEIEATLKQKTTAIAADIQNGGAQ